MIVRPVSKFVLDNKKKKNATEEKKNAGAAKILIYYLVCRLYKFTVCLLW